MDEAQLPQLALQLRREAIEMLYTAQSGHPGSTLSIMDVLVSLYFGGVLHHHPEQPDDPARDIFLLSNGHACPALYVVLAEAGYFDKRELKKLRQLGAAAQGHPHHGSLPGLEISSGSLGQGLSVGIGMAYAFKQKQQDNHVFVMMSDGEQQEGSTWEAIMLAPKLELTNLIAIVDKNQFQIDGATTKVMPGLDPLAQKYEAFNWHVLEIDGHTFSEILPALQRAKEATKPTVIISHSLRGKGVSFMEGSEHWHAGAISAEQYQQAIKELT
jgi:transketolase